MKTQIITLLSIPLAFTISSATVHAQSGFSVEPHCQNCQQCEVIDCENNDNSLLGRIRASWAKQLQRGRRSMFRMDQRQKNLKHPECPPFLKPAWGYHETCWRRFPPTCPCPPANSNAIPIPAAPTVIQTAQTGWKPTRVADQNQDAKLDLPLATDAWQPTSANRVSNAIITEKVWQLSDPKETMQAVGHFKQQTFLKPLVESTSDSNR